MSEGKIIAILTALQFVRRYFIEVTRFVYEYFSIELFDSTEKNFKMFRLNILEGA